jgi:hypothetical protein
MGGRDREDAVSDDTVTEEQRAEFKRSESETTRRLFAPSPEPPPGTRLVLMSDELFEMLGADRVEWGEPDEHGWYVPTVYRSLG